MQVEMGFLGTAGGPVGYWGGMSLSGLRGFLRWLARGSVKVEEGLNWVGRELWGEFEVLVISDGNMVTGVCSGVWVMLGVSG